MSMATEMETRLSCHLTVAFVTLLLGLTSGSHTALPGFTTDIATNHFHAVVTGSSCRETVGFARMDDWGEAFVDGVSVGISSAYNEIINFTAACNATTLALVGYNNYYDGGIIGAMGDLVTDLDHWKCSSHYEAGWAEPGFNYLEPGFNYPEPGFNYSGPGFNYSGPGFNYSEQGFNYSKPGFNYSEPGFNYSSWAAPDYVVDTWGPLDGPLHGVATVIWNAGRVGYNAYCRASRPQCIPTKHGYQYYRREYTAATPLVQAMSVDVRSRIECGSRCLQHDECVCSCYDVSGYCKSLSGCCGYVYNSQTRKCTLYEADDFRGYELYAGPGDAFYAAVLN